MKLKSLLLISSMLFASKDYCASADSSKEEVEEITIQMKIRIAEDPNSYDWPKDPLYRFTQFATHRYITSKYNGLFIPCYVDYYIIDPITKYVTHDFNQSEMIPFPFDILLNGTGLLQNGDTIKVKLNDNVTKFLIQESHINQLKCNGEFCLNYEFRENLMKYIYTLSQEKRYKALKQINRNDTNIQTMLINQKNDSVIIDLPKDVINLIAGYIV